MTAIYWNSNEGRWVGLCPRCGHRTYFESKHSMRAGPVNAETLFCPGGHGLYVEYELNSSSKPVKIYCPIDYNYQVPNWLPDVYKNAYIELLEVKANGNKRSAVAMCSILLEAHVNELIKNPGEKNKSLFDRLEILQKQGLIDKDQFTNATITRITRNGVMHPKDILGDITDDEMNVVFEEISSYLERTYRFRSSRALPQAKTESISGV